MKRLLWLLLLPLLAHAGEPQIRLLAEPAGDLAPGQSLELRVQLLVPSYFLAPPHFPELQLDDGSRAAPEEGQNLTLHIDGQSYAGIQRSYRFAPLPVGHYRLREQRLTLRYADAQSQPREVSLALPALAFTVSSWAASGTPQPGVDEPQLRLSEAYRPATRELQVGDILLRELRIELHDAGALLPPAPELAAPAGARLYRGAPQLEQDNQRGARLSVREEQLRYLLLEPGSIELPAVHLQWRDTRSGRLQQVQLPARRLQVQARPGEALGNTPARLWPGALLVLLAAGWLGRARLRAGWHARRRWQALRRAARRNDAPAAERALQDWLESLPDRRRQAVLAGLREELEGLYRARYAAQPVAWQGAALLQRAARRRGAKAADSGKGRRLNP